MKTGWTIIVCGRNFDYGHYHQAERATLMATLFFGGRLVISDGNQAASTEWLEAWNYERNKKIFNTSKVISSDFISDQNYFSKWKNTIF